MGCDVHSFADAEGAPRFLDTGPDVDVPRTEVVLG
jgi:hypothetical protein